MVVAVTLLSISRKRDVKMKMRCHQYNKLTAPSRFIHYWNNYNSFITVTNTNQCRDK